MLRTIQLLVLAAGLGLATAGPAHAQRSPDMATLDRGDGISKLGLDGALSFIDEPYSLAIRLELYGQYVSRSGIGIYGSLPLTSSFGAPDEDEDPEPPDEIPNDATTLGNAEVGGMYVVTKSRELSFVFHAGLSLPTSTNGRDEAATRYYGAWPRMTDLTNTIDDWAFRFGFSPLIYGEKLFARFDLGVDLAFGEANPHILRFNLGGGVDLGVVALSLELCNSVLFVNDDEDFIHTLAFTVRFMGERFQPYLSVGAPLDDNRDAIQLFVAGGLQFVP